MEQGMSTYDFLRLKIGHAAAKTSLHEIRKWVEEAKMLKAITLDEFDRLCKDMYVRFSELAR